MPLVSKLLSGDSRLQNCLVSDPAHVTPGSKGPYVSLIQKALILLDGLQIDDAELRQGVYGPSTAAAVVAFKTRRGIINRAYQQTVDDIVGKMTIAALDREMAARELAAVLPCNPRDFSISTCRR
ncbi:hypothetical protein MWN34_03305 [Ancylobacter sp. 6x-1]|uniref:Peptidoglycan binding-like domain-containing protein n=1 Tax=Ancylobacter crimeensis TaxID=2579147 RepID=A0ABT0D813_9HYPH|nr:hypothetical protein [Ancylobacter crimeensis]MCK0195932.1 hypothetical protein [Ancylobacter crimeensis]